MGATLHAEQMCQAWPKHEQLIQYVDCVMVPAVKIVTELPAQWAVSLYCGML